MNRSLLRFVLTAAAATLMPGASLATRRTVTNDAIERAAILSMPRPPRSRHLTLGDHVALQAAADRRARKAAVRAARGH